MLLLDPGTDDGARSDRSSIGQPDRATAAGQPEPKIAAVIGIAHLRDMTGASLRALRHYESAGLLSPLRTANGARLFTPAQARTAAKIVLLRRLDVPVRKIGEILDPERAPDARAQALKLALEVVSAKLTRRLEDLRDAIAQLEGPDADRELSTANSKEVGHG
jgi:DNA-binding transcriptional MerR regulator